MINYRMNKNFYLLYLISIEAGFNPPFYYFFIRL